MIGPFAFAVFLVERHENAPNVWGAVLALQLYVGLLVFWYFRSRGFAEPGPGSGGGGGLRPGDRRPPAPLPPGPVCWTEFEREFAEYVARCERSAAGD